MPRRRKPFPTSRQHKGAAVNGVYDGPRSRTATHCRSGTPRGCRSRRPRRGSKPAEDLISAVSKRVGFKHAGPKIRDRVASAINVLLQEKKLSMTDDNRVKVQPTP